LISATDKGLHRGAHQVEFGQSSNKPVKAKLRRRKRLFLPLQQMLLTTKCRVCKE
jgi:hypothetical protein